MILDIEKVREPIPVHVAEQNAPGIVAERKARTILHSQPPAPIAVAEIGPVLYSAAVNEHDILHSATGHVGEFHPRIGETHVGKLLDRPSLHPTCLAPSR